VSSERCDMGYPEHDLKCLRPKGHYSSTCPCFSIYRDPKSVLFGMGVYIDRTNGAMEGCTTWLIDDEFPDDIVLEVCNVKD
jgi:hypothetical protein